MSDLSFKTVSANKSNVEKKWVLVDVEDLILGRVASQIATYLRGKHKPNYTPHVDCGDNVVVINASKVKLSGDKWKNKKYIRHTGYPGGQRSLSAEELFKKNPIKLIENAVKGMLPKNKLGREISKHIRIYKDTDHGHGAQQPKEWSSN